MSTSKSDVMAIGEVYYGLEIEPTKRDFGVFRMLANMYGKDFVIGVILDLGPQLLAQEKPLSYLCGAVKGQAKRHTSNGNGHIQDRAREIESFITNSFMKQLSKSDLQ